MGTVPEKYFFSSENIFISVLTSSTMTMITISEHYIHCIIIHESRNISKNINQTLNYIYRESHIEKSHRFLRTVDNYSPMTVTVDGTV